MAVAKQPESQHFERLRTMTSEEFFRVPIDLALRGNEGQSLLHVAIARDKFDIAVQLVERGHDLDVSDVKGQTPLHYAVLFGRSPVVDLLLDRGANPNAADKFGNGPLWYTVTVQQNSVEVRTEIAHNLLRKGADPNHQNRSGKTPHQAAATIASGLEKVFHPDHGAV